MKQVIKQFSCEHRFLSNFFPAAVKYKGHDYATSEHAFQAAKAEHESDRAWIAESETPGISKRRGRSIELRPDWEQDKNRVMYDILRDKFKAGSVLAGRLEATGEAELVEGNKWGDTYWGVDETRGGFNILGQILMLIRTENRG
jgi:ribA/ribD-fused uncharacterized protein